MPLTEEERRKLQQVKQQLVPPPTSSSTRPPDIANLVGGIPPGSPYISSSSPRGGRINYPKPASEIERELTIEQLKNRMEEESATRRQLLRKAADQKLQLEQGIALFNKIFDEAETDIPVIERPEGTLPFQRLGRWAGRETGYREKQRGTLNSLRARATPSLKSLGEVGVLTNQDIDRILKGGFPADDDTVVSRTQKRIGLVTDLQMKLNAVNTTLGQSGTRQSDQPVSRPGGKLMVDKQGRKAYVYPDGSYEPIP